MIRIAVQAGPIDIAAEMEAVEIAGAGGIASFVGRVRADGGVTALELEHYPGMTETALRDIAEDAGRRWPILAANVVHRAGVMVPGDRVVLVAVAGVHRAAALDACAFVIDRLKTGAPFWKRERRGGDARWVEARAGDETAAARWD